MIGVKTQRKATSSFSLNNFITITKLKFQNNPSTSIHRRMKNRDNNYTLFRRRKKKEIGFYIKLNKNRHHYWTSNWLIYLSVSCFIYFCDIYIPVFDILFAEETSAVSENTRKIIFFTEKLAEVSTTQSIFKEFSFVWKTLIWLKIIDYYRRKSLIEKWKYKCSYMIVRLRNCNKIYKFEAGASDLFKLQEKQLLRAN